MVGVSISAISHKSLRRFVHGRPPWTRPSRPSAASFFTPRVAGAAHVVEPVVDTPPATDSPHADELAAYLALPQIEYKTEWDALDWWKENTKKFPNLSVMARQYLGCPASSATVERLFSQVGIAFSARRKSASAETIADIIFTKLNVA